MKILMKKSVISSKGWRWENKVYEVEERVASDYLKKGIGVEAVEETKEQKVTETKEEKIVKKRVTKKAK